MRIAHYNILQGGQKRIKNISKVIKQIDPDICGILEAVGWQKNIHTYRKLGEKMGYQFFNIAVANYKHNIALFSKIPLDIKIITSNVKYSILQATIKKGQLKNTKIFFVHLSPVSEDARLLEIDELLKHTQTKNIIVMGDFNSLSEADSYDKEKLLKTFQKTNISKYGTTALHFEVIKKVEHSKLVDAAKYLKYPFTASAPTKSNVDVAHATNLRIDYAFVSTNILKYLKKIEIFKSDEAEIASDHYPLVIELSK
jgi:endonuclease/exonuclease/phosphatase family metal-dependent hydrolase